MNTLEKEVAALRQEVEAMRAAFQAQQPKEQDAKESGGPGWADLAVEQIRSQLAGGGFTRGIGVIRAVLLQNSETSTSGCYGSVTLGSLEDVPTEEQLQAKAELFGNVLTLRVFAQLETLFLQGQALTFTRSEMAKTLNVADADLEAALRPAVKHGLLRWIKTASGEEGYEREYNDVDMLLLTLP